MDQSGDTADAASVDPRAPATTVADEQRDAMLDAVRSANEEYNGWGEARRPGRHRPFDVPAAGNAMLFVTLLAQRRAERQQRKDDDEPPTGAAVSQGGAKLPWMVVRSLVDALPGPLNTERSATAMLSARSTSFAIAHDGLRRLTPETLPALRVSPWVDGVAVPGQDDSFVETALRCATRDLPWLKTVVIMAAARVNHLRQAIVYGVAPHIVGAVQVVDEYQWAPAEPFAAPKRGLEHLRLTANGARPTISLIDAAFAAHPVTLQTLDVTLRDDGEVVVKHLAERAPQQLQHLSLSVRNGNAAAAELFYTVPSTPPIMSQLRSLEVIVENVAPDRMHLRTLFGVPHRLAPLLESLTLVRCGVTSDALRDICRGLDTPGVLPSLRTLSLATNLIDDAGIAHLASCRRVWGSLEGLDLRSNPMGRTSAGVDELGRLVECHRRATALKRLQIHPAGGHTLLASLGRINYEKGAGRVF